ncbi:MAG: mate efflux family protein [Candidatus Peregrinibacteria bacterium GW2011_GWE2_39_6]|nr:MAG: mate efflux family protein [Candidatus Peregrinibacteria bacterium GW2011_GWF2_39_17]KKR25771.1 MAG: mate efflux family protein [Candidatus Peregrinibacteria bacterium GW2011_GWE2_39_6]HCW32733.1 MATE family efflux transporter [Candidatus Peregrinibacteria bacterium]
MQSKLSDLTEGSIISSIFKLAIPIVFANILQTAYQLVDTFWVGRLGAEAVAAVSLSFPIIFLMISLGGGLAMAGAILVAQYKGKKDLKQVNYISAQTFLMMLFIAALISIIGYFISEPIMKIMGAEANVLPQATSYLQISFIGMISLFGYFVFQSLMRGVGEVKIPVLIVLGTVILNLILDPLFIFGFGPIPGYGVKGAALATIATQSLATLIGLKILITGKYGIHLQLKNFKPDFALIKRMFYLGFPSSVEQSTRALGMAMISFLAASFGTLTIAAYGIGSRILGFIIIPALGFSMATSTLVGQNIGANKIDRAAKINKISSILAFSLLSLIGIILYFSAEPVTTAFIPNDQTVIASASLFIKIISLTFGFIGLQMTINGTFRGAGDTVAPMIISIISLWIFQFPLAYALSKHTSLAETGIWWAVPISNILASLVALIWFSKGTWKTKKLIYNENQQLQKTLSSEIIIEEGVQ